MREGSLIVMAPGGWHAIEPENQVTLTNVYLSGSLLNGELAWLADLPRIGPVLRQSPGRRGSTSVMTLELDPTIHRRTEEPLERFVEANDQNLFSRLARLFDLLAALTPALEDSGPGQDADTRPRTTGVPPRPLIWSPITGTASPTRSPSSTTGSTRTGPSRRWHGRRRSPRPNSRVSSAPTRAPRPWPTSSRSERNDWRTCCAPPTPPPSPLPRTPSAGTIPATPPAGSAPTGTPRRTRTATASGEQHDDGAGRAGWAMEGGLPPPPRFGPQTTDGLVCRVGRIRWLDGLGVAVPGNDRPRHRQLGGLAPQAVDRSRPPGSRPSGQEGRAGCGAAISASSGAASVA